MTRPRFVPWSPVAVATVVAGAWMIGLPPASRAQEVTEVTVERVRPKKEKHQTLRFLKENRDFIRARFDLIRQEPKERRGDAGEIDPRYLAYQRMLAEILAAKDSLGSPEEERRRRELLASVTQLADLEAQLDLMERLLAEQRGRLGILQNDFAGDQRTALVVVVSGFPADVALSKVDVQLEDGANLSVEISPEQRGALMRGGVVQIFHGFVEPREQVVQLGLTSTSWPSADPGFVVLEPTRDRLTFLRLDLSQVHPDRGATGIRASIWLHDARTPSGDG